MGVVYDRLNEKAKTVEKSTTNQSVSEDTKRKVGIDLPLYHSTAIPTFDVGDDDNEIAIINKAMQQKPVAAASYRLSAIEKKRLEVAIFELKMRGLTSENMQEIITNENELMRIALNHLLDDYKGKGDESILVRALLSKGSW